MMHLTCDVLAALKGKTLVTAESCTGGGIGAALTAVPGSSSVYKGGIICYTNWVKEHVLGVPGELLEEYGAVSGQVAAAMAECARERLQADIAVSVTGLAGPDGDDRGNPIGMVYIGYCDARQTCAKSFLFKGCREAVREQAICAALEIVLKFGRIDHP